MKLLVFSFLLYCGTTFYSHADVSAIAGAAGLASRIVHPEQTQISTKIDNHINTASRDIDTEAAEHAIEQLTISTSNLTTFLSAPSDKNMIIEALDNCLDYVKNHESIDPQQLYDHIKVLEKSEKKLEIKSLYLILRSYYFSLSNNISGDTVRQKTQTLFDALKWLIPAMTQSSGKNIESNAKISNYIVTLMSPDILPHLPIEFIIYLHKTAKGLREKLEKHTFFEGVHPEDGGYLWNDSTYMMDQNRVAESILAFYDLMHNRIFANVDRTPLSEQDLSNAIIELAGLMNEFKNMSFTLPKYPEFKITKTMIKELMNMSTNAMSQLQNRRISIVKM